MINDEKNLEKFKELLLDEDRSLKTINSYINDIKQFFEYINKQKYEEIHNSVLKKYKEYLLNKLELAPASVNRKLISVHRFLEFNEIPAKTNPFKIQKQNFLENVVSQSEIEKIVKVAKADSNYKAIAIFKTLELTGMRAFELLQLTTKDIHSDEVMIIGKGNKSRMVLIPKSLKRIWLEYYQKERIHMKKAQAYESLFIGQRGPMSRNGIDLLIKKYGELAGIDYKKNHAHGYRHGYCKTLSDNNVPIDTIADLAGHSSIETTRIYTRKSKEELRDVIDKINR